MVETAANNPVISSFVVEGAPLIYFGELYFEPEDAIQTKLVFKRALIRIIDSKAQTAQWIKVPTSGKDSLVYINTNTIRGILVKNIDSSDLNEYREASLRLYSKLTLA